MKEFITRQLFPIVLSLSLSGTLTGILIAAIRPFTGRYFSKKWNYYIWLLVIARLLLPFHFESNLPIPLRFHAGSSQDHDMAQSASIVRNDGRRQHNDSEQFDNRQQPEQTGADQINVSADTAAASANAPTDITPILPDRNTAALQPQTAKLYSVDIWTAAAYLWLTGAAVSLLARLSNYRHFKNGIKKNCKRISDTRIITVENVFCSKLHIEKKPVIFESTAVSSPMTIGLWNPVILIPKVFSDQNAPALPGAEKKLTQLRLVLHHELIHVARKDLPYKWICQILLCIHWFNPVLYSINRQINRDCELSCDERILSELTDIGKQTYGNILLDTAEQNITHRQNAFSTTLLENKKDLKKRLDNILHYRKTTRFQLALSACVFMMILTLSACSMIWIPSDPVSTSDPGSLVNQSADSSTAFDSSVPDTREAVEPVSKTDRSSLADQSSDSSTAFDSSVPDAREAVEPVSDKASSHYDTSDETGAFMQMFSSLVSADSYVNSFAGPDRTSGAWNVYDDDELLAGDDLQDNWGAFNYMGGSHKILAYGFVLYGSDSFVIAYADQDIDVKIKSSYDIREGNFKIISIAPDKSITTLNDTGAETTTTVTMKKGRNVLKMVGQGARVTHLEIDYTDLDSSDFENIFYSEDEEYIHLVKSAAEPVNKDRVIKCLGYLDEKDTSELFHIMLNAGTAFTSEELCDFLICSDAALSNQYLLDALRNQTIEPPGADAISELMPYLTGDCAVKLLKSLPVEEFFEVFAENIVYLNDDQISECLTDYLDRGGELTDSMYDEISPFVGIKALKKIYESLPDLP